MNKAEIWKPVVGFEDTYAVSNLGNVVRLGSVWTSRPDRTGLVMTGGKTLGGYRFVKLRRGKRYKQAYVHSIVCEAFFGTRPEGFVVDHIDGNKNNNVVENLEWVTPSENNFRRNARHGGAPWSRGEKHPKAILNAQQVRIIRSIQDIGVENGWKRMLAVIWGISDTAVGCVARRINWSRVA